MESERNLRSREKPAIVPEVPVSAKAIRMRKYRNKLRESRIEKYEEMLQKDRERKRKKRAQEREGVDVMKENN